MSVSVPSEASPRGEPEPQALPVRPQLGQAPALLPRALLPLRASQIRRRGQEVRKQSARPQPERPEPEREPQQVPPPPLRLEALAQRA